MTKRNVKKADKSAQAEQVQVQAEQVQVQAEQVQAKHAIFNASRTIADAKNAIVQRQAKAMKVAKIAREHNKLFSATIVRNNAYTRTAYCEICIAHAARHVDKCSLAQLADFLHNELKIESIKFKAESSDIARLRNHINDALETLKLAYVDSNDIAHFSENLIKLARNVDFIALVDKHTIAIKNS